MNKDNRFAKDPDFVFMAQQYLERHAFENQISISVQRGFLVKAQDGSRTIKSNNVVDVFKKIPGTPQTANARTQEPLKGRQTLKSTRAHTRVRTLAELGCS